MMQNFRFFAAILLISVSLISCHKDSQINKRQNNSSQAKYYIKSFASSLSDSTTYSYDKQMRLSKKVVFGQPVWNDSTIYLYSYNNKGQLDTITTKTPNGLSWVLGYQTCEYNSDGALSRINDVTSNMNIDQYTNLVYNNHKQIDSLLVYISDSSGNYRLLDYSRFFYDSLGRCHESEQIQNGIIMETTNYTKYDNYNSMYQGLPIYNYGQLIMPAGFYMGENYIVPINNVLSFTYNTRYVSGIINVSYIYNTAGFPTSEIHDNFGQATTYRITYYEK